MAPTHEKATRGSRRERSRRRIFTSAQPRHHSAAKAGNSCAGMMPMRVPWKCTS
jgi:hypothetical protein